MDTCAEFVLWSRYLLRWLGCPSTREEPSPMAKKSVEFDAHKTVKKPTRVSFTTKEGDRVKFEADKKTKVPVHVKFKANPKKGSK